MADDTAAAGGAPRAAYEDHASADAADASPLVSAAGRTLAPAAPAPLGAEEDATAAAPPGGARDSGTAAAPPKGASPARSAPAAASRDSLPSTRTRRRASTD